MEQEVHEALVRETPGNKPEKPNEAEVMRYIGEVRDWARRCADGGIDLWRKKVAYEQLTSRFDANEERIRDHPAPQQPAFSTCHGVLCSDLTSSSLKALASAG